jgi:hypothetical protein
MVLYLYPHQFLQPTVQIWTSPGLLVTVHHYDYYKLQVSLLGHSALSVSIDIVRAAIDIATRKYHPTTTMLSLENDLAMVGAPSAGCSRDSLLSRQVFGAFGPVVGVWPIERGFSQLGMVNKVRREAR